jgi:RNA polymerase sigma factor (sigma-70 family)
MGAQEFDSILLENTDFLKPFAITLTRDSEVAKDLFQETVYRALANRDKYNVGTNIRAWLYTIMRNIFINSYRRKIKQRAVTDTSPYELILDLIPADQHAGNPTYSSLQVKDITRSIYELPEIFRNPFLLYFEGFRYHEIARMLKEPLGTIKSRIHFARKILKTNIERN